MLEPASEAEVQAFEAWLSADADHGRAYAETESLAALSARLPRRILASPVAAPSRPLLRPAFAVVAVVFLIVASALVMTGQGRQAAYAAIANPGPAVRGFRLSDGTTVILDSGARLAVSFDPDARTITLQSGRVRFNVAQDVRRPFSVKAAQSTLRAGGAVVDVDLSKNEVSIRVVDGDALLTTASSGHEDLRAIRLDEGRAVIIRDGRLGETKVDAAAARWPEARLAFDDASLATIVELANRRGRPKIILADAGVGALRVTGVLDIRDTRSLARKLAATLDLRVEEHSDELRLTR